MGVILRLIAIAQRARFERLMEKDVRKITPLQQGSAREPRMYRIAQKGDFPSGYARPRAHKQKRRPRLCKKHIESGAC